MSAACRVHPPLSFAQPESDLALEWTSPSSVRPRAQGSTRGQRFSGSFSHQRDIAPPPGAVTLGARGNRTLRGMQSTGACNELAIRPTRSKTSPLGP
jgi:hypothetical protein